MNDGGKHFTPFIPNDHDRNQSIQALEHALIQPKRKDTGDKNGKRRHPETLS
jgi:hypothetical protein